MSEAAAPSPDRLPPVPSLGPPLNLRLRAHRESVIRSLDNVANIGCCLGGTILGYGVASVVAVVFGTLLVNVSSIMPETAMGIGSLFGLVCAGAALYGLRILIRLAVNGIFRSYYQQATRWLYHTDLLSLFVDENQITQIIELIEDLPGLRWLSPPRPKKLEDLIEFAACYFSAYRKLLHGPGRLDGGTVFLGSLMWYTGQRQCVCLGCCCSNPYSAALVIPLWAFTGISYINRLAVEVCCLDYLLGLPRDPRDAHRSGMITASHDVGV